jgi:hypothetical protein
MDPRIRIRIHPQNVMDPQHCYLLYVGGISPALFLVVGVGDPIELRMRILLFPSVAFKMSSFSLSFSDTLGTFTLGFTKNAGKKLIG